MACQRSAVEEAARYRAELHPDPASVGAARSHLREWCADLDAVVVADALVVLSEIVTNAVRRANDKVAVELTRYDDHFLVEVVDDSVQRPFFGPPSVTRLHGRGLLLVEHFSSDWGVRARKCGGKTLWFRMDLDTRAGNRPTI